jgi:hypothetical protein
MYCLDSHGSDIDHFFPKVGYELSSYSWRNFVLSCTHCGRFKGNELKLVGGRPLLLNPFSDRPWDHLTFDPATGNLTAKYDAATSKFSLRGEETVRVLQLDRREGLSAGYRNSYSRVLQVIAHFLNAPGDFDSLVQGLALADEHGLCAWIFGSDGHRAGELVSLRAQYPVIWRDLGLHFGVM